MPSHCRLRFWEKCSNFLRMIRGIILLYTLDVGDFVVKDFNNDRCHFSTWILVIFIVAFFLFFLGESSLMKN